MPTYKYIGVEDDSCHRHEACHQEEMLQKHQQIIIYSNQSQMLLLSFTKLLMYKYETFYERQLVIKSPSSLISALAVFLTICSWSMKNIILFDH